MLKKDTKKKLKDISNQLKKMQIQFADVKKQIRQSVLENDEKKKIKKVKKKIKKA